MIDSWIAGLQARGAHVQDGTVTRFDAPSVVAGAGAVIADLSHRGLIAVEGEDGESFLQGQLSNDVRDLAGHARYAAYCTPKGRMLAFLLVWRDGPEFFLELPRAVAEGTRKRLSMYVLRAKARLRDASDERVRIGVAGEASAGLIAHALGGPAPGPLVASRVGEAYAIGLAAGRFELVVPPSAAPAVWDRLAQRARPVGAAAWDRIEIRDGIPEIVPETQEAFVPQMANLDAIGGLSFTKGCYPGQEIVARIRYLGQVKRRMLLAHVDRVAPVPGQEVFSPALPGQSVGTVVRSAPAPDGGHDLLAVIQIEHTGSHPLHLGGTDGPELVLAPLPYAI
jgi:tRNA-modifying protein YgfZ